MHTISTVIILIIFPFYLLDIGTFSLSAEMRCYVMLI